MRALITKPHICRMIDACLPKALHECVTTIERDQVGVVGRQVLKDEHDPIVYTTRIVLVDDVLHVKTWRAFEEVVPNAIDDQQHMYAHARIPASEAGMSLLQRYILTCCAA